MPILRNARHERFCQELAAGKNATEAYVAAGYKPNGANAGALRRQQHISTRLEELLAERERVAAKSTEHAIEATGTSKAAVVQMVLDDRAKAREAGQYGIAVRCAELLARLHGYIIDRKDVRLIKSIQDLTDEELEVLLQSTAPAATEARH